MRPRSFISTNITELRHRHHEELLVRSFYKLLLILPCFFTIPYIECSNMETENTCTNACVRTMSISSQKPAIPHYHHAPGTEENCRWCLKFIYYPDWLRYVDVVDWADLAVVDMSNAHSPEGRRQLTKQVHDAIKNEGFLYVVNHGIPAEQVRQFALE